MYRSTKGASKARRDQINAEIRKLKDLLPISDADKARLSYLHIMSLACMYTRKSVFFSQDISTAGIQDLSPSFMSLPELSELMNTLPGFLLLVTSEGKLLYLTDNVTEHLGHSMVDLVSQSDSVYDIIDQADHFVMRSNLVAVTPPDTERLFRCRFNTSKFVRRQGSGNKVTLVRARCLPLPYHASTYWTSNAVWVCFCSPLELQGSNPASTRNPLPTPPAEQAFQLTSFHSQHSRDMRIQTAQECVSVYLGYDVDTLRSRSWYSLLHPRDLSHASAQHCALLREEGERQVEMVVQVEAADHSWVWLYMVLQLQSGEHPITCQNYVISESEACSVRQQLNSEQNQLALLYQEGLTQQFSHPLSSPEQVFTPSSSGMSAQSFDFSFTVSGRSSSEELPSTSTLHSGLPLGSGPCPNFPIDESNFSQQQGSHQLCLTDSTKFSTRSDPTPHSALTVMTNMAFPTTQTPVPLAPLSNICMSKPHSTGELLCTPPYTPRLGGGHFIFGEDFFKPDLSSTVNQTMHSANHTTSHLTDIGMTVSAQHCSRALYEKLPPTPDSPVNDECALMALPEIRGPLYVDVPHSICHGPPEGLLTPEASPTEQRCPGFFSQRANDEREKIEISLLAQYLSSVAEGFWKDHSSPVIPEQKNKPLTTDFPPTMCCEESHSLMDHDEKEENIANPLPAPYFSSHSPHSSTEHTPPAQVSTCTSGYIQEEALVGVQHLCSVQSTHCTSTVGGRSLESGAQDEGMASMESLMDDELTLSASPQSTSAPENDPTPGLPCDQSLLEELVNMEPVFEAAASINPALRQQPELYQLSFQESPQHFYQDGTSDHMF